jgi:hypothetical protein
MKLKRVTGPKGNVIDDTVSYPAYAHRSVELYLGWVNQRCAEITEDASFYRPDRSNLGTFTMDLNFNDELQHQ